MRSQEQKQKLLAQQEQFEQQLFSRANKEKEKSAHRKRQLESQQPRSQKIKELISNERREKKQENDSAQSKAAPGKTRRKPRRSSDMFDLYGTKDSHPIIEYTPSKEDAESASLTPSFVLEVTWPRVVQFYHPSSPRCQALQSTYVAVARGIKRRSSRLPVEFHAVNCGVYRDVCEQGFNVKGVPTFLGLRSGSINGMEMTLPGSTDGSVGSKQDITKDVERKVKYIAQMMGIPLDVVKKGHAGAAFARPMGIDANSDIEESVAVENIAGNGDVGNISYESSIPVAEQVFHDAKSSLLSILTSSLYSQFPHNALPPDTSRALAEFLDLIRWAFPPETQVHDLAEDLRLEYSSVSKSEKELLNVVERHIDLWKGITWSTRCSAQAKGGFSCGLWSLLHILSIGVAERHMSVMGDVDRVSVTHAGQVLRSFIDMFFIGCDSCRESWVELFDEACGRSASPGSGKGDDWRSLAIWIWEVHNGISILRQQSSGRSYHLEPSRMASSSLLWPSKDDCPKCWQSLTDDTGLLMNMDSYDRDELYIHLKKIYWPDGVHNNRLIVLNRWSKAKRALNMKRLAARMASHDWPIFEFILNVTVGCLILLIAFPRWSMRVIKRASKFSGRHRRQKNGKKHKEKEHAERSHLDEGLPNFDISDRRRNQSHYPFEPSSIHRPRQSIEPIRSDNRRGKYHHHHIPETSYRSHHRHQEGRRRRLEPKSRSKKNHLNHLLEL